MSSWLISNDWCIDWCLWLIIVSSRRHQSRVLQQVLGLVNQVHSSTCLSLWRRSWCSILTYRYTTWDDVCLCGEDHGPQYWPTGNTTADDVCLCGEDHGAQYWPTGIALQMMFVSVEKIMVLNTDLQVIPLEMMFVSVEKIMVLNTDLQV